MQDYTEEEKAYIFERASLIVLPIGAGMTNLIWAADHAKVVFLCAPSLQSSDVMGQSICDWPRDWFVGQYLSHKKMQAVVLRHGKLAAAADQQAEAAAAGGEGGGGSNDEGAARDNAAVPTQEDTTAAPAGAGSDAPEPVQKLAAWLRYAEKPSERHTRQVKNSNLNRP